MILSRIKKGVYLCLFEHANTTKHVYEHCCSSVRRILAHLAHLAQFLFFIYLSYQKLGKQGRIHGQYQLRTGGQGRKCVFSHFSTCAHGPTEGWINGPMDGWTKALLELRVRN